MKTTEEKARKEVVDKIGKLFKSQGLLNNKKDEDKEPTATQKHFVNKSANELETAINNLEKIKYLANCMNLPEMLNALVKGKKIRKINWNRLHYIQLKNGKIVDEKNNEFAFGLVASKQTDITMQTWVIYTEPPLDEVEKQYLSNIIAPFRDKIEFVCKLNSAGLEKLCITYKENYKVKEDFNILWFPSFKEGNMYKHMEIGKEYTLEELGL